MTLSRTFVHCLVLLFTVPTGGMTFPSASAKGDIEPKTECLATDEDYSTFVCLPGEPLRIPCEDEDGQCPEWAARGECSQNPAYMLPHCRKSCASCISLHPGDVPQIAPDQKTRHLVLRRLYETQEYLHFEADRNVETLRKCLNKHSECTHWWANGECSSNAAFMEAECSPACQTCDKIVQ
ncbi:ShK domain-like protein [Nitzschia inconspicua]|uniref:ShK domain-like protein n=1 Tax=Nitzschia inconspicua TaxID=303405 RepID=A0A9K3KPI3_9STRA|nr:ShK domain-like protein [Nitzschia inconspicua]